VHRPSEVANLLSRIKDRRVVTYGFSAAADLRAENVVTEGGVTRFDALVLERSGERRRIERITLPMPRPPQRPECAGPQSR
jgi:UDP-N-acetylmuramate--alanine ligase